MTVGASMAPSLEKAARVRSAEDGGLIGSGPMSADEATAWWLIIRS